LIVSFLSFFVAILVIVGRQISNPLIYDTYQIEEHFDHSVLINKRTSLAIISKDIRDKLVRKNANLFVLSEFIKNVKSVAFLEVKKPNSPFNSSNVVDFSVYLFLYLRDEFKNVICLSNNDFIEKSLLKSQGVSPSLSLDRGAVSSLDEPQFLYDLEKISDVREKINFEKIVGEASHTIFSLPGSISEQEKIKFVRKSDLFIFVAEVGKINLKYILSYKRLMEMNGKQCIGCVLVK